ncbi:hypothetical protein M0805_000683 [Coniferiporia weirii]|nr:hypothetical protein M0805_000683 [Coniferiporia weirii]
MYHAQSSPSARFHHVLLLLTPNTFHLIPPYSIGLYKLYLVEHVALSLCSLFLQAHLLTHESSVLFVVTRLSTAEPTIPQPTARPTATTWSDSAKVFYNKHPTDAARFQYASWLYDETNRTWGWHKLDDQIEARETFRQNIPNYRDIFPYTKTPPPPPMTTTAKEINLAKPNKFDGTREYARHFLSSCETYLRVNKHIYDTDELKINFVLSFMQTRTAGDWAINCESLASAYNVDAKGNKLSTIVGYGTWDDFVNDFKSTFITTDDTNEAQQALIKLKQTGTADDFNNQFQSLATRSGITSPEALIALYQAGLTPALLKTIYNCDTMPSTINDWYKNNRFRKFSNNYPSSNHKSTGASTNTNRPPRLTPEERDKCFKEGRCLACREKGHNSRDCPKFPTSNSRTIRATEQTMEAEPPTPTLDESSPTPSDVALQIRQLINSLKDEEKEELFNTMDKQDF